MSAPTQMDKYEKEQRDLMKKARELDAKLAQATQELQHTQVLLVSPTLCDVCAAPTGMRMSIDIYSGKFCVGCSNLF